MRIPGEGRRELVLVPGRYAALAKEVEHSEELGPLAKELRRLLTGTKLVTANEPGGERYLEVEFLAGSADPPLLLAVELFGTGNLLIAREGKILAVQHAKTWAHRSVRIGAPYERPPSRSDPWKSTPAEIQAALSGSRTDRATTLAARLSLGGPVAEEVLVRAGLAGSLSAPTEAERAAVAVRSAIERILADIGDAPQGYLYLREDLPLDVEPFPSERFRADPSLAERVYPTFSEAALTFFRSITPVVPSPSATRAASVAAELNRQRSQQATAVADLEREAIRLSTDAETLLHRFPEAEAALQKAVSSPSDVGPIVEIQLGDRAIVVPAGKTIREAAQALFEESKRVRSKLEGAKAALAETDQRLLEDRPTAPSVREVVGTPAAKAHHVQWFERYRWFLSSERILVIEWAGTPRRTTSSCADTSIRPTATCTRTSTVPRA